MVIQFPSRMYGNTPGTTKCVRCGSDTFLGRLCYCCKWEDRVIEDGETGEFIPNPQAIKVEQDNK